MKLKLAEYYSEKYPKGHVFEIENIMRSEDCASGVKVKVRMGKSATWFDLGWFVPPIKSGLTKRSVGRVASAHPIKSKSVVATRR